MAMCCECCDDHVGQCLCVCASLVCGDVLLMLVIACMHVYIYIYIFFLMDTEICLVSSSVSC